MNETNLVAGAGVRASSASPPLIVCTTLNSNPSWRWFAPRIGQTRWEFFAGKPRNWLERTIKRPALASWRGCWESIGAARRKHAALVISHDARITFRCASARGCRKVEPPTWPGALISRPYPEARLVG